MVPDPGGLIPEPMLLTPLPHLGHWEWGTWGQLEPSKVGRFDLMMTWQGPGTGGGEEMLDGRTAQELGSWWA